MSLWEFAREYGLWFWAVLGVGWLVRAVSGGTARPSRRRGRQPPSSLDWELMRWTPHDPLTVKGLLDGGVVIFGRPGSGKSSSSSFQLLKSIVAHPRSGGLILSASPGDLAMCRRVFAGREDRLIVFDETTPYRLNAIGFILACGGSTKDVLAAILAIEETVARGGGRGKGGDDGGFFATVSERTIECGIIVVKHATGTVRIAELMAFIHGAAGSPAELHADGFKTTLHYRFLKEAYEREKSPVEAYDFELARTFFTDELPKLADRTRSGLIATVMNTLHVFNSGVNRLLFATETNLTPEVMDRGKWVFVNQPISRCGVEGAFSLGLWKFLTEWYLLRRDSGRENPPLVIHADEFHNTINAFDTRFLAECRKFGGCMVACSQSKASFYASMGGEASEAQVDALLNNFTHKIIHALGDVKSSEWASSLIGSGLQFNLSGSGQPQEGAFASLLGQGRWTGGYSETMRPVLEPCEFMHGFRTGGPGNGFLCDAIVIRSGEPFANGESFLRVAFSQK